MARKLSRFQQLRADARELIEGKSLHGQDRGVRWRRFVHFWVLVWRSFVRNRCQIRASALSYGSLLALIPVLAVVMSITSSLLKKEGEAGIEKFIVRFVASAIPPAALNTNLNGSITNQPITASESDQSAETTNIVSTSTNGSGGTNIAKGSIPLNLTAEEERHLA